MDSRESLVCIHNKLISKLTVGDDILQHYASKQTMEELVKINIDQTCEREEQEKLYTNVTSLEKEMENVQLALKTIEEDGWTLGYNAHTTQAFGGTRSHESSCPRAPPSTRPHGGEPLYIQNLVFLGSMTSIGYLGAGIIFDIRRLRKKKMS